MAPTRQKKRKSTESTSSVDVRSFPAPPQLVPTKTRSPMRTPTNRSPIRKSKMGITIGQKQALIDNLQLEITERARKLRAQYKIQAEGLRARIDIRVNRIPTALRKATMGELLMKYSEVTSQPKTAARTSPIKPQSPAKKILPREQTRGSPSPQRPVKRLSEEMSIDKENEDIENPKKRPRGPPQPPSRTTSRANIKPSQVLSPRSANSQTHQRSPIRPTTAQGKSFLARPISPLKPSAPVPSGGAASILTNMVEKAKTTRSAAATRKGTDTSITGGIGRGKRAVAPAPPPKGGRGRAASDSSNTSGSTVIRKAAVAPPKKPAPAKRTVMSTIKGMGGGATSKKAPGPKTVAAPPGRVLRKRN